MPNLQLVNCSIVDANDREPRRDAAVQIVDGRIVWAGPRPEATDLPAARVLDLEGGYLTPGLMDCHAHLFMLDTRHPKAQNVAGHQMYCANQAVNALRGGFTGLRVVGEGWGVDVALRDAFNAGYLLGPRMWVAGEALTPSGGHLADREEYWGVRTCDGVEGWRKAARDQLQLGADHLKAIVTGGAMGHDHDVTSATTIVEEELQAAAQVFKGRGRFVVVHATASGGARMALRAGARTVEHGYTLDDETIDLFAETGTYLTPTLSITHQVPSQLDDEYAWETFRSNNQRYAWKIKRAEERLEGHQDSFIRAYKAGVRMLVGSDFAPFPGASHCEMAFMSRAGMAPWDVLVAATRNAADAVGQLQHLGTVEAGKWADLIAVADNPVEDIRHLRHPRLVLLGGRVAVDEITGAGALMA